MSLVSSQKSIPRPLICISVPFYLEKNKKVYPSLQFYRDALGPNPIIFSWAQKVKNSRWSDWASQFPERECFLPHLISRPSIYLPQIQRVWRKAFPIGATCPHCAFTLGVLALIYLILGVGPIILPLLNQVGDSVSLASTSFHCWSLFVENPYFPFYTCHVTWAKNIQWLPCEENISQCQCMSAYNKSQISLLL